ncbi:hypothetical protein AC4HA13_0011 [Escherichia phage vB_EcoM_4HA13]|uniref:Uncharacterized protein n=1 Tax=Escherichia phage vB_EcoM_4HA13 TaxID=2601675 RepID=A0A7D0NI50_9CAUD|nr:hypothetical protein HYP96_gp11 [Escherichia phage vB_EcoM_4HA13]QEM42982.1 hypothetical protein AC4HA13_0011 [Escherichia phage vB_EcoM_4HA13]
MLLRDKKTGRLKKQPAKIGDKVIVFGKYIRTGLTAYKPYKIVATQNSKTENRKSFGTVYPLEKSNLNRGFGVFIIDNDGDKAFLYLGEDVFGMTVEKLK